MGPGTVGRQVRSARHHRDGRDRRARGSNRRRCGDIGIFLPAFFFVALSGPLVPKLRQSQLAGAVLDGVNVASLALMAVVSWRLGATALG